VLLGLLAALVSGCSRLPETLAIGAPAPAFSLPGADGKTHTLAEYASSPVLVVVFTCNHCPASQLYEQRIQQLHKDYTGRGVSIVAINPVGPKTTGVGELAYSDVPDTLAGMTERAKHRRLEYAYLYDGDAQAAAAAFKVVAMPQVFVFDAQRTLQYVGRIDDNVRADQVKSRDARAAIDALLAKQSVPVQTTRVEGCPIRWQGQPAPQEAEQAAGKPEAVGLKLVGAPDLKALRGNGTPRLMMINFWATWCPPCVIEFPELQNIYRTYRSRELEFVTVSIDFPEAKSEVTKFLNEQRASSTNVMFSSDDTAALQEAFDPAIPASVPFTLLLAPNGDVVHQQFGEVEFLPLRRAILANLPEDPRYPGLQAYWVE
jgi:thiol-disulfide isomerase/thioredoxin